jgi:MoaA/NifB/PqqE/SkfB family radical SAM enzyme
MSIERAFWRATLDTNPDHCNLNCIMCEDHSPYGDDRVTRKAQGRLRPIMGKQLLEKVIREAAALGFREIIPSTMGEPLLYPHFERFLDLCQELDLSLNLTTNGTFPCPEKHQNVEYWAKRIVPLASDVKISWNGASDSVHREIMLGSSLAQHIDHAKRFIAVRDELAEQHYCSMTLQLTFMRRNLEEIPDMVRLAIELGFDRVKGHQLWAHFPELELQSLRNDIVFAEQWNRTVNECQRIVAEHRALTSKALRLDNFFELDLGNLDDIAPGGECPFLNREIWVDPAGRFNVCCAPDQQRKSLGEFGNLKDQSLAEIIDGTDYADLVKLYPQKDLCQACNMRRPA